MCLDNIFHTNIKWAFKFYSVYCFLGFSSEEELLCHLKASYDKIVTERDSSLLTSVQQLLNTVKTFLVAKSDWEVRRNVFFIQTGCRLSFFAENVHTVG